MKSRTRAGSDVKHDRAGLKGVRIKTKKGGAGGNFTWGKPGDEANLPEISKGDPNYDSGKEDNDAFMFAHYPEAFSAPDFSYLNGGGEEISPPELSLSLFKENISNAIKEYFTEGDVIEFVHRVEELKSVAFHYELVKKLVSVSMEKTDRERELCSKILVELQDKKLLPISQLAKAFERLFENVDDIQLDVPNVKRFLAQFLARCVVDEVLPPAFLTDKYVESLAGSIVMQAKVQLSMKHNYGRIERVWGPNKNSTLEELKHEIKMIILEYLSSSDCTEVATLIKKLNIPFYHHEIIKRGVVIALEHKEREQAMISVLFKELVENAVISSQQCIYGFQRLYQEINDLRLDYPDAELVLDIFAYQAMKDSCLSNVELNTLKEKARRHAHKVAKELRNGPKPTTKGRNRAFSND